MRLDNLLVQNFNIETRSKALRMIKNGYVFVNGICIKKGGYQVFRSDNVTFIKDPYVSRSAWKLKSILDTTDIDVREKTCLDVGSSTGGFTQVLLENGAKLVVAVDVGSNQLHKSVSDNPRVISYENTDIRDFSYSGLFDILVCDVSFISASSLFVKFDSLVKQGGDIIILFKPQFEVDRGCKRNKKGVVIDKSCINKARRSFVKSANNLHWNLLKNVPARIKGKSGNQEFVYWFRK